MQTQQTDRQLFLDHLRRSGLIAPQAWGAMLAALPTEGDGRDAARALVGRGTLTKFQAEMLLAGRSEGFYLGQYRILDQIGRGGMGRVFKAEHLTMNRVVALKVLATRLTRTKRARDLFQREIRAAAQLHHPNLVSAFDANQAGDRHYLVMEYVDGPNLLDLVRQCGPLPVELACAFVGQAAQGLQHAFERGMVHRDIKPANLLVARGQRPDFSDGTVKILDFGLARLTLPFGPQLGGADSIVMPGNTVMGTPDYLSPEQARDLHAADIRSDLYSLGCTFFFLLTGLVPYPADTTVEKMVRHSTEPPPRPEQFRPSVPPGVGAIVQRLMAKNPADRFQSPAELADTLVPFANPTPEGWIPTGATPAPPVALPADASPWATLMDSTVGVDAMAGTLPPSFSASRLSAANLSLIHPPVVRAWRWRWLAGGGAALLALLTAAGTVLLLQALRR